MDRIDTAIIGAGVIGLAIARRFAMAGRSVLIMERERQFGTGISARSSEVIHAGLYYPPGSLKERLCLTGRELLYAYCAAHGIAHRRCGKLIVAQDTAENKALDAIAERAARAGVNDLQLLDRQAALRLEPALQCAAALHSPSTGIIDSHGYMLSLLGEAEDLGAMLVRGAPAERVERRGTGWIIHSNDDRIAADIVINAAGLSAWDVAARIDGLDGIHIPPRYLAKGSYFAVSGAIPFDRLIYPVPVPGGLGTHLTLDLAGQARLGPDVEWMDRPDLGVDPARRGHFASAARRFWPSLDPDRLCPAYAGIRPKLAGLGEPAADFAIHGEGEHGLPGVISLYGIESPGLTASLAIADHVFALAAR